MVEQRSGSLSGTSLQVLPIHEAVKSFKLRSESLLRIGTIRGKGGHSFEIDSVAKFLQELFVEASNRIVSLQMVDQAESAL